MEELVFAIPTHELWKLIPYKESGFISARPGVLEKIVAKGIFHKRSELEEDPAYKQLIPYGIISAEDSYFLFRRTSGQTEKRLHNKLTLGVGGHMNPGETDKTGEQYIISELKRELFEEVKFSDTCSIKRIAFIGFVNDDSIRVGRMHIGLVYNIQISNKDISIKETEKMTAEWIDKQGLMQVYEGLESWSRFAFDYYIR